MTLPASKAIPDSLYTGWLATRTWFGRVWTDVLPWTIPVFVAVSLVGLSSKRIEQVIGVALALVLVAVMVPRPAVALIALVIFLPVQSIGFGLLLGIHFPASLLRVASSFKELMGICILLAALRRFRDRDEHLDRIDKALLAYVGAVTVYLLIPHVLAPSAPLNWSSRLLAWRSDCAYVLIFFAVRHAGLSPRARRLFAQVVIALGVLIIAVGLYQRVTPNSYAHFILHRAHQPDYLLSVLHYSNSQVITAVQFFLPQYGLHPLHVSSIFLSPYDMSDYLILVVALCAERISRDHRSPMNYIILAGAVATLFFSRVRADALAAVIILALIALPAPRRPTEARLRFVLALAVGAAIIIPTLGGTRYVGAEGGSSSSAGHIREIRNGISIIANNPLGLGLGNQPATASRFSTLTNPTSLISDNSITQVGDELGIEGLVPWLLTIALVLAAFRQRIRWGDELAAAAGFGLLGVLIAGQYHHVFLTYPGPWTLWAAVGLALPPMSAGREAPRAAPTAVPLGIA